MRSATAFTSMATLALSIVMSACASFQAPYQPLSFEGPPSFNVGYTETEVQPGVFLVQFISNARTPADRPANYVLLRGAEICLKRGEKYLFAGNPLAQLAVTRTLSGSTATVPASETSQVVTTPAPDLPVSPIGGIIISCSATRSPGAWDAEFLASAVRAKYSMPENAALKSTTHQTPSR